jgi:DNA-binding beta-propeller fold protein YncE
MRPSILLLFGAVVFASLGACESQAPAPVTPADPVKPVKRPQSENPYTLFETLQVRPLALSPSGKWLFAANTPDNRLEVFAVEEGGLKKVSSVVVGLEPIAVAARPNGEVWVANHLSDSVSIVRVDDDGRARLVNTLLVGDEPRDIVFAGPDGGRAFVTTAHRGQNSPDDPDLFDPAAGRADVWVFDADKPGERLTKITVFADTPRALAASADSKTVYVAAFLSGNQTTAVSEDSVYQVYGGHMPGPGAVDVGGVAVEQPHTSLIVKWKEGPDGKFHWIDAYGSIFDKYVKVSLPDEDVFAIDAMADPPVAKKAFAHVGTTLFNMAVNPKTGKVYVSNTEAHNDVRFSGHTPGFTSVTGNLVDSRITVIDPKTSATTVNNLNPHLDHAAGKGDASLSLAFPQDLTFSSDGKKLYVVAQGSGKLAVYDAEALESGTAAPSASNQVVLSAGGPAGVVLDERRGLAFVLTRFDNGISIVDTASQKEVGHVTMFNPEPSSVVLGRPLLYDATISKLGDQACASCHIGADVDGLAWDLGSPGGAPLPITTLAAKESEIRTIEEASAAAVVGKEVTDYVYSAFQPCKGPMVTQSLRGLDNAGPMHWRGDRNGAVRQDGTPFLDGGGDPIVSAQPDSGIFDERKALRSFDIAFPDLVGSKEVPSEESVDALASFLLEITYPPNPIRNLDDSLTPTQAHGAQMFDRRDAEGNPVPVDLFHTCQGCHIIDRDGNRGHSKHPGFFGTDGRLSFDFSTQTFKVPHLRNMYQKVGMFASAVDPIHAIASLIPPLNPAGPAVRGFGFSHDGVHGKIEDFITGFTFLHTEVYVNFGGITGIPPNRGGIPLFVDPKEPGNSAKGLSAEGIRIRQDIAEFLLVFDTNLFPIVGQQITLTDEGTPAVLERIALLESQALAGRTDLVAHGTYFGQQHGFTFSNGQWIADDSSLPPISSVSLQQFAAMFGPLTFTAVPPGTGWRVGIDRDVDGYGDADEIRVGTDPADASSHP